MTLKVGDVPTWTDLCQKFLDQYRFCAETPPTLLDLSMTEMKEDLIEAGKKLDMGVKLGRIEGFTADFGGLYPCITDFSGICTSRALCVALPNIAGLLLDPANCYPVATSATAYSCSGSTSCWTLRNRIQEMIDARQISFNEVKPPNVRANPLPDHGSSSGPSVNMISIATIGENEATQKTPIPLVINHAPTEVAFAVVPFVIEPADKGKAPATAFSAIPEAVSLPTKKVTDQEAEAFMKVIKVSEYKVVEQMGKSPAHISLLALLLSSEPHRNALLKVLAAAPVPKDTAPDRIKETVNSIFSNQISFAEDELPSEGQGHLRALHIVCKCNNHVIGRVMIDNGSALNICPVSTLKQVNVDMSRICASKTTVRAFDFSKREVNGEIDLLIDVLLKNDYVPGTGLGARTQGILRPIEMEEYRNRRGLGFRPSCHEIVQARHGKHLYHLAAQYGKLFKGIPIPPLSQFFAAPPQIMGGTSDSPITKSDDFSSDAIEAFLALPAIYAVTKETSSRVHNRPVQEDEKLTNWTSVPLYSAIVADV
ncbi:hypothetical protein CRG98_026429 [Punica granatum]|uniref:G-patch domain-containing protein n=1 Tax=Punica granatum TaxID=22663 RepID=A0A2I0JAB5_PUNGR|nr:hypothetical protein CRG98_026429 [Punica granatum]